MGEIIVLNQQGDETIEWDPQDSGSVTQAENRWKELKEAGYRFFAAEKVEVKGKEITEFSPKLGKIIAAPMRKPAMAGGPVAVRS